MPCQRDVGAIGGFAVNQQRELFGGTPAAGSGEAGAAPGPGTGGLYANGGVFAAGHVIHFAQGGIVDRPTLFAMANGMGLMSEAGPEAVLPLQRLASGRLGVEAAGSPQVTVNIINNTGARVTTEQRQERGGPTIDVLIDAVETQLASRLQRPGTVLNKALRSAADPIRAR